MPKYTGTDGAELYFEDRGDGDPLVVIAGGAPRHPDYLEDLAGLGEGYRLIVVHLRGVGESPAGTVENATWWSEAADLECLRVALGLDQLNIVAHSSGTRLAIAYAAQYPGQIERMVLIAPPASYLVDVPSDVTAIAARRTDAAFRAALARLGDVPTDQESFDVWSRDTAAAGYAVWGARQQRHAALGESNYLVHRIYFSATPPDDLRHRLASIAARVLVVAGAEDALMGTAQPAALAEVLPNATCAVIEGSGHFPWVDRPDRFVEVVRHYLAATRRG